MNGSNRSLPTSLIFPVVCYVAYNNNNNNNNNIYLLQTHGPYTYKKIVKTYISTVIIIIIIKYHKIKIMQINITLISTVAEWESEYKQSESCMPL